MPQEPVLEQLERVLQSRIFRGKAQLKQLLTLLVQNLETQNTLKPDRIIRELWPGDADSKSSADLAPAVTRLRKALECYYAEEGRNDPTMISLPDRSLRTPISARSQYWIICATRAVRRESEATEQKDLLNAAELPRTSAPPKTYQRRRLWLWFGVASFSVLLLISVLTFWFRLPDVRPQAARLDGNTLTVIDATGKALWSKSFPDGFWSDYYKGDIASRTWFGDLDGDGIPSVLLIYHPAVHPYEHSSILICYSARGVEKWRWNPGRAIPELHGSPPTFFVRGFGVLKGVAGAPARIVVVSPHEPLDASQVALIDSHGRTISEYWHSGHLDYATLASLDDGRQFIVTTGVSNGYNQATLLVLDPDRISGASIEKESPAEQIQGMSFVHERLRVLFPRSDVNIATRSYNAGLAPIAGEDGLRVSVRECDLNPDCRIWYEFDRKLELRSVYPDDRFRDAHRLFFETARRAHSLTLAEESEFRKVRCLEGCRGEFVAFAPPIKDDSALQSHPSHTGQGRTSKTITYAGVPSESGVSAH
jgi:hypothetical protein